MSGQQARRGQRPVGDITQHEARLQPRDAWKPRKLLFVDALVIGEIARSDGDEIVVLAGHQMTGDEGGRGGNALLEGLEQILVLTRKADMHDDGHAEAKRLPVDARLIALNDALLLKRADAPGDCRGGKRNAFGKLDLARTAVLKQRTENRVIQRIEFDLFHFPALVSGY